MPNTLKFRCTQVNTQLQNQQIDNNRHDRQPITSISFQIVAGDDANSWMRNGGGNNQANSGSRNFTIATVDPIASIGFRVGRDYRFSIEEWDYAVTEDEVQEVIDGQNGEFNVHPMNRAERRRQARQMQPEEPEWLRAILDNVAQNDDALEKAMRAQRTVREYNDHLINAEQACVILDECGFGYEFGAQGIVLLD